MLGKLSVYFCLMLAGPLIGLPGAHGSHVAQEMAALCSLAFIRSVAMLDVLRSGSMLRS